MQVFCSRCIRLLSAGLLFMLPALGFGFEPFIIKDIRVEGLQRISAGTVFNYLPLKQGDKLDEDASARAIQALYKTGFFKDVVLEREGDTLIVFVEERPAIASIKIEGNEDIPSEQLTDSLKTIGFAEGRVFDRSMLDKVEQELKRQYLSLGKYSVRIESRVTPLERNRVAIEIDIREGEVATIQHINIVGNTVYPEQELLDLFQLGTVSSLAFFSSRDQYSKQKLAADLETLRSYYMDRGYINFSIDSTQVSITPDKQHIYVTINISEGEKYTVKDVRISGETIVGEEELRKLISIKAGDVFSRREVTESSSRIGERLGDKGYAFANVNPFPDINEEKREVTLTFFIDPGKRIYVRRINISGNARTRDEVIRRELRQMESAWISTEKVKRSRTRIDRLGYFSEVDVSTPAVPGSADEVDVDVKVTERDTFGSLNLGVGYSDSEGLLYNASVNEENFLGSGKRFSLAFNNSDVNTVYSFSFTNPYYTMDGVSRGYRLFYRETDTSSANVAEYSTDNYGAGLNFGVPVSEYDTMRYNLDYEHTHLYSTSDTSQDILDFCEDNASIENCEFDAYKGMASWSHDTRNKAIFPTTGSLLSLSSEVALPLGDESVNFYKLRLSHRQYIPLFSKLTFAANGEIAYANAYGQTTLLPPFEKYYAGGMRTVRGYKANSLGPQDESGDPLGGNARVLAGMELLFPLPGREADDLRFGLFVDAGNVFDTNDEVDLGDLRLSTGLSMVWLTPVGPLSFSVATPLNDRAGDETEGFQFTLGAFN